MNEIEPIPEQTEESSGTLPFKRNARRPFQFKETGSPPEKGNDIWLYTLSDLLLLLTIFFVLLFAFSIKQQDGPEAKVDAKKAQQAALLPAEKPLEAAPVQVQEDHSVVSASSLETELTETLSDANDFNEVAITKEGEHLILTFPEKIVFDPGQAQLKASVQPILDKVAGFVLAHPTLRVEVQGHTDDRPINTSRYPSNWELSVDRATQVAKALIRLGLNPTQLSVKGFGQYQTLYPNDNDEHRLRNRRVQIQLFQTQPS